jgi:hypothetical protein
MHDLSTWLKSASGRIGTMPMAAVALVVVLTALIPLLATPRTAEREIVLVARGMAFYVEGSNDPNPTLVLTRGEQVRVIVRNEDPGITHGFGVSSLAARVDGIRPGTSAGVSLRAPDQLGRYEYVCPPHAVMMKGTLLVTD